MPRGVEFKIPLQDALEAHRAHLAGWSIRALSRLHWKQWGYASAGSAECGLRGVFRALELPIRSPLDAKRLASTVHGHSQRAFQDPAHPEHERYLRHKQYRRQRNREAAA